MKTLEKEYLNHLLKELVTTNKIELLNMLVSERSNTIEIIDPKTNKKRKVICIEYVTPNVEVVGRIVPNLYSIKERAQLSFWVKGKPIKHSQFPFGCIVNELQLNLPRDRDSIFGKERQKDFYHDPEKLITENNFSEIIKPKKNRNRIYILNQKSNLDSLRNRWSGPSLNNAFLNLWNFTAEEFFDTIELLNLIQNEEYSLGSLSIFSRSDEKTLKVLKVLKEWLPIKNIKGIPVEYARSDLRGKFVVNIYPIRDADGIILNYRSNILTRGYGEIFKSLPACSWRKGLPLKLCMLISDLYLTQEGWILAHTCRKKTS